MIILYGMQEGQDTLVMAHLLDVRVLPTKATYSLMVQPDSQRNSGILAVMTSENLEKILDL